MYLRYTMLKKEGKVHRYWRLVRSVRVGRRVIQQTVAKLGELDEWGRRQTRALVRHLIGEPEQAGLFDDGKQQLTVPVRLKDVRVLPAWITCMDKGHPERARTLYVGTPDLIGQSSFGERHHTTGKSALKVSLFCSGRSRIHA
jgi:hypothetical protein